MISVIEGNNKNYRFILFLFYPQRKCIDKLPGGFCIIIAPRNEMQEIGLIPTKRNSIHYPVKVHMAIPLKDHS